MLGMPECALGFTHVGEPGFIDDAVADRPGMTQVVLLVTFCDRIAEPWQICARCLEIIERAEIARVGHVVVSGKVLLRVDVVIEAELALIAALVLGQYGYERAIHDLRNVRGYVVIHQIDRDRILAGCGNRIRWENTRPRDLTAGIGWE